jgi:hypothetical protein
MVHAIPRQRTETKTNPIVRDNTQPNPHLEWRWMVESNPIDIKKPAFNFLSSLLLIIIIK